MRNALLGCSWLTILVSAVGTLAAADGKPNILLIMADDVGSDALGSYGGQSYPTPHLDALARGGMKFTHAYAMPVCHPSRICLMTGCYPLRFGPDGSRWGDFPRAAEADAIGNRLKRGGYATAVAGKWQLCLMKNDLRHPQRLGFDEWCLFGWHEGGRYHDPLIYQNGRLRDDTDGRYGPDLYVEFLTDFMRRARDAGQPFFAYYPMALCHDVTDDLKGRHVAYYKDGRWMTFGEMMASLDDMVGRLISALDQLGVRDNTLVLFTTDNGTAGASYLSVDADGKMTRPRVVSVRHGRVVPGGKGKLADTGTRVPLIASWPGRIAPGQVADPMVDLTDYLPTLAEVAGLPADDVRRDGVSFAARLLGTPADEGGREWVYIENRGKRCVRSRDWKLYGDGRFFDLRTDAAEATPLDAAALPPAAAEQRARLADVLQQLNGPFDAPR